MAMNNLSVKAKLTLLAGLFVAGMVIVSLLSYTTINDVKIGGEAYGTISLANGVLSDFALPTQFAIQERILVYRMRIDYQDKPKFAKEIDSFAAVMKGFEEGHAQWRAKISDPRQTALIKKIYETGHTYNDIAWNKYVPLLQQGNLDAVDKVRLTEMNPQYDMHEAAANELVAIMQEQRTGTEKSVQSMIASRTLLFLVVGLLATAVVLTLCLVIAKGILTPLDATIKVLRNVSLGDLSRGIEVAGTDEFAQLGTALNETVAKLSKALTEISSETQTVVKASGLAAGVSKNLGAAAQSASTQAAAVSAAAEQVSQTIQTVSTATEEMSSSIREISKNASEAAEVASSAARLAGDTTSTMTKLSESSAEIGNVIKVITSIAEQTNLLALNATIEAARAGEAGKGFAVVANEVKELAKETAKATDDIGKKVEAIQHDAKGAVQAIDEVTSVIGRINDIQNTIASAVEEQTGTTNEISRNISETAKGSSDIATNMAGVAAATREAQNSADVAGGAAQELQKIADSLTAVVGRFKLSGNGHFNSLGASR